MVLLGLFLAEVGLHLHYYYRNGYWLFLGNKNFAVPYVSQVSDRRGYSLKKGFSDGVHTINQEGFRGNHVDHNKPAICVIGDSVPYGAGVADRGTFSMHLQQMMEAEALPYSVLNGGVPSYNLRQSIDRWRFDIDGRFRCKVVIINAANDVSLADFYKQEWDKNITWAKHRFNVNAVRKSAMAFYLEAAMAEKNNKTEYSREDVDRIMNQVMEEVQVGMREMKSKNLKVLLMPVQPCYYQNKPLSSTESQVACHGYRGYETLAKSWNYPIEKINQGLRSLADAKDIDFFDSTQLLDGEIGRAEAFVDFIHFSDQGNKVIARGIFLQLMKNKWLEPSPN